MQTRLRELLGDECYEQLRRFAPREPRDLAGGSLMLGFSSLTQCVRGYDKA